MAKRIRRIQLFPIPPPIRHQLHQQPRRTPPHQNIPRRTRSLLRRLRPPRQPSRPPLIPNSPQKRPPDKKHRPPQKTAERRAQPLVAPRLAVGVTNKHTFCGRRTAVVAPSRQNAMTAVRRPIPGGSPIHPTASRGATIARTAYRRRPLHHHLAIHHTAYRRHPLPHKRKDRQTKTSPSPKDRRTAGAAIGSPTACRGGYKQTHILRPPDGGRGPLATKRHDRRPAANPGGIAHTPHGKPWGYHRPHRLPAAPPPPSSRHPPHRLPAAPRRTPRKATSPQKKSRWDFTAVNPGLGASPTRGLYN